jgi:hypothetical protein
LFCFLHSSSPCNIFLDAILMHFFWMDFHPYIYIRLFHFDVDMDVALVCTMDMEQNLIVAMEYKNNHMRHGTTWGQDDKIYFRLKPRRQKLFQLQAKMLKIILILSNML